MNNIKYIFFDFNGTLLNDVNLCLDLLNEKLIGQNKDTLTLDEYKHVFKFPIKDYYRDAGLDFNIESYESMADKFIAKYQPLSLRCGLYECVKPTLKYLYNKGIKLIILSASETNNLNYQVNHYGINEYFDAVLGIDNIYAESKMGIGLKYINSHNIKKEECIFVGDTLHDFEIAKEMGVDAVLVECGHQAYDVIRESGAYIIHDIGDLKGLV
jgi:phosphoglycolate phosphatase